MSEDKVRDKVRKLLNLANNEGATEDEADTAMRMASRLMAEHGIAMDSIGISEEQKAKINKTIAVPGMKRHQIFAAQAAGVLFNCDPILAGNGLGVFFIGREDNAEAAEDIMFFLIHQIEHLYKRDLPRGLSQGDRAKWRKSFKEACGLRVFHRAVKIIADMKAEEVNAAKASGAGSALMIVNHFAVLAKENQAVKESMTLKRGRSSKMRAGIGTNEGRRAGDEVVLTKNSRVTGTGTRMIQ